MPVKCALTGAEHIRTAAAANLANQIATMSCAADDLLERHTVSGESRNCGMAVLAPQIALIAQLFRTGQQFRIDRRRTQIESGCLLPQFAGLENSNQLIPGHRLG